jgi:hypothetical protein
MNPIISSELTLFAKELQRFLSPIVLQETAKQVGFVQRSSKYQSNALIALCVWLNQEVASTSHTQGNSNTAGVRIRFIKWPIFKRMGM